MQSELPVECPGTHEPGASANGLATAPPERANRDAVEARQPKAQVSVQASRCRKGRGYLQRKRRKRPQENTSLVCAALLYRPQMPADLPDPSPPPLVVTQHLRPVPSPPYAARSPTGRGAKELREGFCRRLLPRPPCPSAPTSTAPPAFPWVNGARPRGGRWRWGRRGRRWGRRVYRAKAGLEPPALHTPWAEREAWGRGQWALAWRDPAGRDSAPCSGPAPRRALFTSWGLFKTAPLGSSPCGSCYDSLLCSSFTSLD